jgi:hypothetical protein
MKTASKRPNKSADKIIWQSSIPKSLKKPKTPKTPSSPLDSSLLKSPRKTHSFLTKQKSLEKGSLGTSKVIKKNPRLYYSIKYLGVTKGEIGVFTKRAPMPQLSAFQTCKDVPLAFINTSLSEKKVQAKAGSSFSTLSTQRVSKYPIKPENTESSALNSEGNKDYVIHTYARPRGLAALHRIIHKSHFKTVDAESLPYQTVGVSGWKLIRPKTTSPRRRDKPETSKQDGLEILCKHIDIHTARYRPAKSLPGRPKLKKKPLTVV